jgi:hypothetical protein
MGVRYTALAYSNINDTPYTIGIYDSSFSGTVQQIELSGDAFSIEYERQGDEKFTAVKGSRCNVYLRVTDDSVGLDLQSWITTNLLASNEDKFQLVVNRDGNLFWVGNILHDLSGRMDASRPYDFTLTATDGLARLKDFTFDFATDNNDRYKMIDYIFEVLKETPLYKLNISSNLYTTCVEWWEDSMPARAANKDPLDFTKVHCYTFTKFDEKKQERTAFTYYEVLEELCKHWGMRVIMSEGVYRFVQVNNYEDDGTTKYRRLYDRTNAYVSNSALPSYLSLQTTSPIRTVLSGNQWNYFAPLKNVFKTFPFENKNMLNGRTSLSYSQNLPPNIIGGTGIRLLFSTIIRFIAFEGTTTGTYRIIFKVKINLNSTKYLKKSATGSTYSWANSSDFAYIVATSSDYDSYQNLAVSFATPEIPAGTYTTNSFSIEISEVREITTGTLLVAGTDYEASRVAASTSLVYNTNADADNQTAFKYQVQNTGSTINSYDIDLGQSIMGEAYSSEYYGGLYVYNGTSYVPSTSLWRIYDAGTGANFVYRLVSEVMAAQILPVPKYQGAIIGSSIYPDSLIRYNSEVYILNGGTFTAGTETWEAEWFRVSTARASVSEIENAVEESDGSNTDFIRAIGGVDQRFSEIGDLFIKGGQVQATYDTTTDVYPFTQILMGDTDLTEFILRPAAEWIYQGRSCEITIINNCASAADEVIITPDGTETINGAASLTLTRYQSVIIVSDGANLFLKSAYLPT